MGSDHSKKEKSFTYPSKKEKSRHVLLRRREERLPHAHSSLPRTMEHSMEEDGSSPALPPLARPAVAKFAQCIDGRNTVVFETDQAPAQHTESAVVGRWTTSSPAAQVGMNTNHIGPGCFGGFTGGGDAPVLCACASPAVGFGSNNNAFGVCQPSGAFTPAAMNSPGAGVQAAGNMVFAPLHTPHGQQCETTFGSPLPVQPSLHAHRTAVPVGPQSASIGGPRSSHLGGYASVGGLPVHASPLNHPMHPEGTPLPVPLPAGMQSHTVNSTTDRQHTANMDSANRALVSIQLIQLIQSHRSLGHQRRSPLVHVLHTMCELHRRLHGLMVSH